nr:MAG TPA_asm: hypothetical protein [Caudoviricetes sp.]
MYNQFVARLITEKLFNLNSCHTHNQVFDRGIKDVSDRKNT